MRASLLVLPLLLVPACHRSDSAEAKPGSASVRSFAVGGFDRVELAGPDDVIVKVGPAFSVTAKGDAWSLDQLDIRVDGGALRIGRKPGSLGGNGSATVTVGLPALKSVSLAGSGDMDVDRVSGDFTASLAGSGDITVAKVTAKSVGADIAGPGDIEMAGTADRVGIVVTGSGTAAMKALRAKVLKASVTGSGDIEAAADDRADLTVAGSGDIDVVGTAKCTRLVTGAGEISCGGS